VARLGELNRLKTEFVDNVSHEFRTPLTVIRGSSQTLEDHWEGLSDAERRELNTLVQRGATHLTRLIETLLHLAAVQSGTTGYQPLLQDMCALAREVVRQTQPALRQRVILTGDDAPIAVRVDGPKLEVVLRNLLDNAAKFAPDESTIVVELAASGAWAEFAVRDSGPGVRSTDRERVFDRFYQADGGPTRTVSGSGIGLALSRELVLLHGGEIFVDPLFSPGARFVVRIPLDTRPLPALSTQFTRTH